MKTWKPNLRIENDPPIEMLKLIGIETKKKAMDSTARIDRKKFEINSSIYSHGEYQTDFS